DLRAQVDIDARCCSELGGFAADELHDTWLGFALVVHATLRLRRGPQALIRAEHLGGSQGGAEASAENAEGTIRDAGHRCQQYRTRQPIGADAQAHGGTPAAWAAAASPAHCMPPRASGRQTSSSKLALSALGSSTCTSVSTRSSAFRKLCVARPFGQ